MTLNIVYIISEIYGHGYKYTLQLTTLLFDALFLTLLLSGCISLSANHLIGEHLKVTNGGWHTQVETDKYD